MGAMTATTEPTGLPPRPLTVADLEGMPDNGHRYELVDGVLLVSPAPGRVHQRVVARLLIALDAAAPAELEVLPAPFAVRPQGHLPLQEQSTELQPDVLVGPDRDYTDRDLRTAPLLAVEVLSPSTRLIDRNLKKAAYERMGAASFWLVDPVAVELTAFELDDDGRYAQIASVRGEDEFATSRPFPFAVRAADLVARRPAPD